MRTPLPTYLALPLSQREAAVRRDDYDADIQRACSWRTSYIRRQFRKPLGHSTRRDSLGVLCCGFLSNGKTKQTG
jgi:hypothetical protein